MSKRGNVSNGTSHRGSQRGRRGGRGHKGRGGRGGGGPQGGGANRRGYHSYRAANPYQGDSDEGLASDEIDDCVEDPLWQTFEWDKKDQDPRHSNKTSSAAQPQHLQQLPMTESNVPMEGWGGALAYYASSSDFTSNVRNHVSNIPLDQDKEADTSKSPSANCDSDKLDRDPKGREMLRQSTASSGKQVEDMAGMIRQSKKRSGKLDNGGTEAVIAQPKKYSDTMSPSAPMFTHTAKRVKTIMTDMVQKSPELLPWVIDTTPAKFPVEAASGVPSSADNNQSSLWVLDTTPDVLPKSLLQSDYIDLTLEHEDQPPKQGRTVQKQERNRKKNRRRRQKVKEKTDHDGTILLSDSEDDDEEDDDAAALEDYLQNTMDSENEDSMATFISSSLHELPVGSDFGGVDSDEEYLAESMWEKAKVLWTEEEIETQYIDKLDYGSISRIHHMVLDLLNDPGTSTRRLPRMTKHVRSRVYIIAGLYKIRTSTDGYGDDGHPIISKTVNTAAPQKPVDLWKFLPRDQRPVGMQPSSPRSRRGDSRSGPRGSSHHRGGRFHDGRGGHFRGGAGAYQGGNGAFFHRGGDSRNGEGVRKGPPGFVVTDGTVVGSSASAISSDNMGHRMLAKMGWSPGVGLGASGSGIREPVEAVMKRTRRGLGHDERSRGGQQN
ncbi:hypothetical protein BC939DRAFT_459837 [Gamsiella multidivaricata]|uniref:uncharacterized protein n=1 Tax=Gamsiella multidivaricata TaxID=101098 RepID=UPI0022203A98|nr:uncharacterized protein BC939DRAFT_459837 [Gamsiella multidivaricata]KAI7819640.1 hypothetical protein BC939DRAFT_459837 [Gamsiella multidivaricata]